MNNIVIDTDGVLVPTSVEEEENDLDKFVRLNTGKVISPEALLLAVVTEAGLEQEDMHGIPLIDVADMGGGIRWQAFQSLPGRDDYVVIAMFVGDQADKHGDYNPGDIRVYAAPRGAPSSWVGYCYTISRVPGSGLVRAGMPLRLFVEEAGYELNRMAVECDVLEDDDDDDDDEPEPETVTSANTARLT